MVKRNLIMTTANWSEIIGSCNSATERNIFGNRVDQRLESFGKHSIAVMRVDQER